MNETQKSIYIIGKSVQKYVTESIYNSVDICHFGT